MNTIKINMKQVGYVLILISLLLGLIVFQYNSAITVRNELLHRGCTLSATVCPFKPGITTEAIFGGLLSVFLFAFGVFLVYTYRDTSTLLNEKIKKTEGVSKTLEGDEKIIYDSIIESDGAIYQKDLVLKTGMSKVKVTRILDFLEARDLVERKRRGMSNLIVLKRI